MSEHDADGPIHDLAILGAGSGGLAAAKRARAAGLSVVQFERRAAGGTCVNRGGVPKKLLMHAARHGDALGDSEALGWSIGDVAFDWATLRDKVAEQTRSLSRSQRRALEEAGVDYVEGEARLVAPDRVRTEAGVEYRARNVIVATGSRPLVPDLPGAEHALVSDDLFTLDALPARIAMIGGGYIAVEFACMLTRFGVEVAIFEATAGILDGFEDEIVARLQASMEEQGIAIHCGHEAAAIEKDGDAFTLELDDGSRHAGFGRVAFVVGRVPNTDDIGLEEIGVELDERGMVTIDAHGRTSVRHVHAIGDVAQTLQLTPVAIADGRNIVDGIAGRAFTPIRDDLVPAAVYATPELGTVGLDEKTATERGLAVEVRRAEFAPLSNMITPRDGKTLIKLVVERGSGTLLGVHAIGQGAAELTQLAAAMITAGLTEAALHRTISLHPTDAEEMVRAAEGSPPFGGRDER